MKNANPSQLKMEQRSTGEELPRRPGKVLPWLMIGATVTVFGAAICLVSAHLRKEIRQQISGRDGEVLYSVALMQQYEEIQAGLLGTIEDPVNQFELILKSSRLRGVIAARLFDPRGRFVDAFPATVTEARIPGSDLRVLRNLAPVSHYRPNAVWTNLFLELPGLVAETPAPAPLLEVNVPIHQTAEQRLVGVAQFIINGEGISEQFAALDRHLLLQGGVIFIIGSMLILAGLHFAFRRLNRANRLLGERTDELTRANQELLLSAKISAVGAVAAHLIHGLKNPLFGLKNLVNQCVQEPDSGSDTEWKTAAATTEKMHTIINDVVRVLHDEQELVSSRISLADLVELIESKWSCPAREVQVRFSAKSSGCQLLPHRVANVVFLILQNLIQNAIDATGEGKSVQLDIHAEGEDVLCEVRDEGGGIPDDLRKSLFAPCRSGKPNGSGIGLAISKQMANHIGAHLELRWSDSAGSAFALRLPGRILMMPEAAFAA